MWKHLTAFLFSTNLKFPEDIKINRENKNKWKHKNPIFTFKCVQFVEQKNKKYKFQPEYR